MKFWKMVLAVVIGLLITTVITFFLISGTLSSLASSSSSTPVLPKSGVMVMDMSQIVLTEQASSSNDVMSLVQGGASAQPVGLWKAVQALNKAAEDPGVKYIFLKADGVSGGISQIQELRKSLENFRKSSKPVIAYIESPTTAGYYLASVADKIYMTSEQGGTSMLIGIGTQMFFLTVNVSSVTAHS